MRGHSTFSFVVACVLLAIAIVLRFAVQVARGRSFVVSLGVAAHQAITSIIADESTHSQFQIAILSPLLTACQCGDVAVVKSNSNSESSL